MDLGLRDKIVVVTGGASGIVAAITRTCLAEGAEVVILSRISTGVPEFLSEMRSTRARCTFLDIELDDPEACRGAMQRVREQHGMMYALVNNAAINDGVSLEQGEPEAFLQSLKRNLLPAFALAHYSLPMLKDARGAIVNIGSKVALTGQGNTSGYAAAKGGLLALTREWAADLLPFDIRVNCVIPAEVMTPAYSTWLETLADAEETLREITAQVPLGQRMTTPEEIASAVVFLLSPLQSSHTTGQQVLIDGGYVHLDRMLTAKRLQLNK